MAIKLLCTQIYTQKYTKISNISILSIFVVMAMIGTVSGAEVMWATGYDVVLGPDELATSGNFTIKAIDFPSPVTGHKTVNGTIEPDYPISPFVTLELYYDIINNPNPIATYILTQGESYESDDKGVKITLISIPGPLSTKWVYQFYDPKTTLRIQTRVKPILAIGISLNKNGNDQIYAGDQLRVSLNIKNVGADTMGNINVEINSSPELTIREKLGIGSLDKDKNYTKEFKINAPTFLDLKGTKDYFINVSATGGDTRGVSYSWTKSLKFSVINRDIKIYKNIRTTYYLKDTIYVALSISNPLLYKVEKIHINESVPNKLIVLQNKSLNWNIIKIDPVSSMTVDYSLKALEPGIYVLPRATVNYTVNGIEFSSTSEEIGLRIFGPKIILKKYIIDNGSDFKDNRSRIIMVRISAKNIGNVFTRVDISDKLPPNIAYNVLSGSLNSTISLYPDAQKEVIYSIKANITYVNMTTWPPANATYYLGDYEFHASSNEKELEISKNIPIQSIQTPNISQSSSVEVTPNMTVSSPRVVATLPIKIPAQMPEKKSIPGFGLYDILLIISLITILDIRKKYYNIWRKK